MPDLPPLDADYLAEHAHAAAAELTSTDRADDLDALEEAEQDPSATGDSGELARIAGDNPADPAFERLLQFLKESRSFDFTGYKRPSLMRRVRHRMGEVHIDSFEDYQDFLTVRPDEFTALFNTILINVTSFFRDEESWAMLAADILPALLRVIDGAPFRVWSAGCSSGHEAYSIAMLLHDLMGSGFRERVKIYATDVDDEALSQARQGSYTDRDLRGLPERFRERYFEVSSGRYVVSSDLRRNVIFGRNDLTRDAPISRIDVLLCRNTLMYFNAETQSRVVSRLGFALKPDGVLFLGKAEMLINHAAVFDPIDLRRRFFRRVRGDFTEGSAMGNPLRNRNRSLVQTEAATLKDELILSNPVAQIAVGADGRLVMVNHRAATMLGLSDRDVGRPFQDLELSYRPLELRSHIAAVASTRAPVWVREVEWRRTSPEPTYVDVQIVPLTDATGQVRGASISFTDVTRFRALRVEVEATNRQLETAYEELQSTNEELETTNEELQSTVEELETTNEELQSTNEELETMNEELQSANDEMQTTNEDLRDRTTEVGDLNSFMQSILGSLKAAVIVVDRDLVVQVWTQRAHELWGLREDETVEQHLLDLDSGLPSAELQPWLRSVVAGEVPTVVEEIEAVNRRGRPVRLRVSVTPLHADGDQPEGALVMMEDLPLRDADTRA